MLNHEVELVRKKMSIFTVLEHPFSFQVGAWHQGSARLEGTWYSVVSKNERKDRRKSKAAHLAISN